jgi:hypothetical protein
LNAVQLRVGRDLQPKLRALGPLKRDAEHVGFVVRVDSDRAERTKLRTDFAASAEAGGETKR